MNGSCASVVEAWTWRVVVYQTFIPVRTRKVITNVWVAAVGAAAAAVVSQSWLVKEVSSDGHHTNKTSNDCNT